MPTTWRAEDGEVVPIPTFPNTARSVPEDRAWVPVYPNNPPPTTANLAPGLEVPMPRLPPKISVVPTTESLLDGEEVPIPSLWVVELKKKEPTSWVSLVQ